ncbi:DNA polymerase-3 subunit alpha [Desulfotomaculum arcticum]|uniref:DNA polymerase III subunit alpha n=1 Tax=Desulfotruncus arcticus DSM 17038 TaxID=1121424 RepID=A0A1I2N6W8_9FIRM|nr:DNA polymerase III subunit alpha [Desulfotruncus arcticus]SFF97246.1 DNA polymerase-3 subunit alpha [Desulfotomaculum arcticum] [Desulfotruncus arcticus DSM 17038]
MFTHLHVHTEYSLLDGAARIKQLVETAAQSGMQSLAITDHGVMYGVVDFYKACHKKGIKPIIGCEVYVAPRTRHDRTPRIDDNLYHLVLLAENETGYRNLLEVVSTAFTEGFYYKPRVDKELLAAHSNGLIALSGCIAGEIASHVIKGDYGQAEQSASDYLDIFGRDNFYLEIQDHGFEDQKTANRGLLELHQKAGIPLVTTNDVHYVLREHSEMQDVLLCIQTGKTVDDPRRMKFQSQELYLKSEQEMALLFGELREAMDNTNRIAERCNVELEFGHFHLPFYTVPDGHTEDSYLRELCLKGIEWRFGEMNETLQQRMDYELKVIKQMGYSAYFLIVWDFIHFAREVGIPVGPGRGSAAGSLVAFVLGITNINPLKYNLLFERFLNPERVSMPDIDIDFCFERRTEVIDYVARKYGSDKVAQIATFGTMAAKAAIRDVGRALGMPYGDVDRIAKMVPNELKMTIEKALKESAELTAAYREDDQVKKLIDMASLLEGMPRHASTHAAGVVITQQPLTHYVPLCKASEGALSTQFPKDQVEELGLLKMDFLGLRTLTVIADAINMIYANRGVKIDIDEIPLDDPKAFELLCNGDGVGVFQLESSGMRAILRDLRPEVFEDIVALVALYRPGPLGSGMVDDFIKNKHGEQKVVYLHPKLEPILRDTYGVILYQEQVMRIASDLAGFTLGEADLLRRAMGKKKPEIIAGQRSKFVEGAVKNNVDAEIAGQVFDLMEYFAGYGFNKSHSAAYALVSYQTAYLKANYPVEFMAALLTSIKDNTDKVAVFIEECRRKSIDVLPPDVNVSGENFTVDGDKIRFGLAAIKNVGLNAVKWIIDERKNSGQLYKSFADFCQRMNTRMVNRRVMENLIKSGALDSLGHYRSQMLAAIDAGLGLAQASHKDRETGQLSLLDFWGEEIKNTLVVEMPDIREFPQGELLNMEKEALGLYVSGHPLSEYRESINRQATHQVAGLADLEERAEVTVGGMLGAIKKITTKKGDNMAFAVLEDLTGSVELVVFPRVYQQYVSLLKSDNPILVRGIVNQNGDESKIIVNSLEILNKRNFGELFIKIDQASPKLVSGIQAILCSFPGDCPVYIYFPKEKKLARADRRFWVNLDTTVVDELVKLLGINSIKIKHSMSDQDQAADVIS